MRIEAAVVARISSYNQNGDPVEADVKAAGSYLLTGDYYFTNKYSFRPFAGVGLGSYTIASSNTAVDEVSSGSKFGGMIRAGIETGHFRLGLEYNLVPSINVSGYNSNGTPTTLQSKNGYLGIKIGIVIGGGPL